jgi:hypothetical protein
MDSTYIIVFKNKTADGNSVENGYFAFVRVVKFEPYISLDMNVKLFKDYTNFSNQILKGENLDCGECDPDIFVEIAGNDYKVWIERHISIYEKIATKLNPNFEFYYKRKLSGNKNSFILPNDRQFDDVITRLKGSYAAPFSTLPSDMNLDQIKDLLSESSVAEMACEKASWLLQKFRDLYLTGTVTLINNAIINKFNDFVKLSDNLDSQESKLLTVRNTAYESIPFNNINLMCVKLRDAAYDLCDKRDIFSKDTTNVATTATNLANVLSSAETMAKILDIEFEIINGELEIIDPTIIPIPTVKTKFQSYYETKEKTIIRVLTSALTAIHL